jgi:Prolyl oligopeptidase family
LKNLRVKTQFVIYPGEGHLITKPENRHDIARRMIAWFDENLGKPAKTPPLNKGIAELYRTKESSI